MVGICCLCCCGSCYRCSRCHPCSCCCCCAAADVIAAPPAGVAHRLALCVGACRPFPPFVYPHACPCPLLPLVVLGHARSCTHLCYLVTLVWPLFVLIRARLCFDGSVCKFPSLSCIKYKFGRCIIKKTHLYIMEYQP